MARVSWFASERIHPSVEEYDWGDRAIGMDAVDPARSGSGVKVAVLDTGIDRAHPDLPAVRGRGFVQDEGASTWGDDYGHGTFVSGVMACVRNHVGLLGVAPDVGLLAGRIGRVDPSSRRFTNSAAGALVPALEWVGRSGADVVNLSLEFATLAPAERNAIDAALARLARRGVVVVAATGNGSRGSVSYPASSRWVLGVGAVGSLRHSPLSARRAVDVESGMFVPRFSNFGSGLDLLAPGVAIPSTHPVAAGSYAMHQGTSVAAPYVSGVCALLVEASIGRSRSWSWVQRVFAVLRDTARPLRGVPPFMQGAGVVDAASALRRWLGSDV